MSANRPADPTGRRRRNACLRTLASLDALIVRPETLEMQMHRAMEHNLWLLGTEFGLVRSNQSLATILGEYLSERARRVRGRNRPDLLLSSSLDGRHLPIEFKRPSHVLTRDDERQALEYRDDLRRRYDPLDVVVIGGARDLSLDQSALSPVLRIRTYAEAIATARHGLEWLLEQLAQPSNGGGPA